MPGKAEPYSDKPKRAKLKRRAAGKVFEFVAPHPLGECVERLNRQNGRIETDFLGIPSYEFVVEIQPFDDHTYRFNQAWHDHKSRLITPFIYGVSSGYLSVWDDEKTYVSGSYYIPLLERLLPLLLLIPIGWCAGIQFAPLGVLNPAPLVVWCIAMGFYLWQLRRLRHNVIAGIQDCLDAPKPDKAKRKNK